MLHPDYARIVAQWICVFLLTLGVVTAQPHVILFALSGLVMLSPGEGEE